MPEFIKLQGRAKDLTGIKFGRLTPLGVSMRGRAPNGTAFLVWSCRCDCGTIVNVRAADMTKRKTMSCGCLTRENTSALNFRHGHALRTKMTSEYRVWMAMKARCQNPNTINFPAYGGRGITVCDRWQTYENFFSDMGARPSLKHSIDRIDTNGNYEPGNCRWATPSQQARNTRKTRRLTAFGETKCVRDWGDERKIRFLTILERIGRGWDVERAISTPARVHRRPNG